jgi:hypothetical protein
MRIQTRRQQIQELQAENRRLVKTQELIVDNKRLKKVQELIVDNILAVQEKDATYTGNRYKTYSEAVLEVANKYSGVSDWGVLQVGNIIDLRAAYIIGQGIKISKVEAEGEDATAEYDFAQRFIDKNELDHELAQDLAREAEIEGKTLIKLFPIETINITAGEFPSEVDIVMRWISWTTNKYIVKVSPDDYLQLESVTWDPPAGTRITLMPEQCVYKRFGGRLDIPNETMPRVAKCLTQIENLDMALRDWRQINRLYAAPTPHVECVDAAQAKRINEGMEGVNWKIGKFFAHTGKFEYAQPDASGQKAIEEEIITLMKVISGTTGIPINALGCPELTTKYGADSQGMLDLIAMSTSKEREVWRAAYQEIIEKAMLMWNAITKKTPLRPELIKVEIPVVTAEQWERIVSTWLQLFNSQAITLPTLLRQVPGLDVDAETEALKEEADEKMEKFSSQLSEPDVNLVGEDELADRATRIQDYQARRRLENKPFFSKRGV